MKPIKHCCKMWVVADMDRYISKFDVYQVKAGANTSTSAVEDGINGLRDYLNFDNTFA